MPILIENLSEPAEPHTFVKEVYGYECNGHRHITDLCRELKNIHVFSYLQIFISVFTMLGCILFRKNIKYIWPQLIPAVTSLVSSAVYLAIYYKEHPDGFLNETVAFKAVMAMNLTSDLLTLIVLAQTTVCFFFFEKIFHQKKTFCTASFIYTVTFSILTFAFQTSIICTGWQYAFGACQDVEVEEAKFGNIVYWGLEHCNLGTAVNHYD